MILESDLAGEIPLYLYWPQDKTFLLYSNSIIELLNDVRVPKPLNVSCEGISFLLQSGVVPPPKTAYKGLYIIGIGDTAKVSTVAGKIDVQFNHRFPFLNVDRFQTHEMQPDEDLILKMLAEATVSRIDHSKQSFLFHSAGKDSNSIALALAEAGWQDKVTLITHKSKGKADESVISGKIAKKLGFKHETLYEVDRLEVQHKQAIEEYFSRAPFPCTDNVSLAYPLYSHQAPHLKDSNIIFGDGNDSHMMSPPNRRQLRFLPYAKLASKLSFLRSVVDSESTINSVVRTPAEWFGMSGLSFKDSKKIYSNSVSVHPYWSFESEIRKDWDIFDFKSDIYSTRTITERMIRKLFNFVAANNSQIVLPFANREVAEYFGKMPEAYLFDRSTLKNKLILREILKKHISLDSDVIGKMGWTYDSSNVVLNNWEWIFDEIDKCKLWDKVGVSEVVSRLKKTMQSNHKYAGLAGQLIYRIFLISSWFNHCRYLA
jgi:asparagine synthase (glutamine-hydrolysing)